MQNFGGNLNQLCKLFVFIMFSLSQKQDYFAEPLNKWGPVLGWTISTEIHRGTCYLSRGTTVQVLVQLCLVLSGMKLLPESHVRRGKGWRHAIASWWWLFSLLWTSWAASEWMLALSADRLVKYFFVILCWCEWGYFRNQNRLDIFLTYINVFWEKRLL